MPAGAESFERLYYKATSSRDVLAEPGALPCVTRNGYMGTVHMYMCIDDHSHPSFLPLSCPTAALLARLSCRRRMRISYAQRSPHVESSRAPYSFHVTSQLDEATNG